MIDLHKVTLHFQNRKIKYHFQEINHQFNEKIIDSEYFSNCISVFNCKDGVKLRKNSKSNLRHLCILPKLNLLRLDKES